MRGLRREHRPIHRADMKTCSDRCRRRKRRDHNPEGDLKIITWTTITAVVIFVVGLGVFCAPCRAPVESEVGP